MTHQRIELDLRDRPAPEPLHNILQYMAVLQPGDVLCARLRSEPCALFPKIDPSLFRVILHIEPEILLQIERI